MMNRIFQNNPAPTIIARLAVGLIFISEGMQKFLFPAIDGAGRFAKIGFMHPEFWACFTGWFEIICGILLLIGLLTRFAAVSLLIIMGTAFVTTKLPLLAEKGFWSFAHEYRTDFAMTLLLLFIIYYGGGNYSLDKKLSIKGSDKNLKDN